MKLLIIGTMVGLAVLLTGCATKGDVEALRNDLTEVHALAEGANQTALNAAQCCVNNRTTIDRMYQKLMVK